MARIALFIPPATGAMNSTSRMAKELAAMGHTVCYMGVPDCEDFLLNSKHEFRPVFSQYFPKGFFGGAARHRGMSAWRRSIVQRKVRAHMERFFSFLRGRERGQFAIVMREVKPDLCLVASAYQDSTFWLLLLHELQIPSAYLNDTFMRERDESAPPVWTLLASDGTPSAFARNRRAWRKLLWKREFAALLRSRLGVGIDWRRRFTELAETCGYPVDKLNFNHPISPRLELPELILWPAQFDFPGTTKPSRLYVGPLIDLDRDDNRFPWEKIERGKELIYCALGSIRILSPKQYLRFYQMAVSAAVARPEQQWVIAVGKNLQIESLHSVPPNCLVCKWAPQIQILEKANIMITHGGANSVKECVWFGVPMIVFPLGLDHPGMAARAAYHGLGVVGDVRRISKAGMLEMINKIEQDPGIRLRAEAMARQFRALAANSLIAALEELLRL